MQSKDKESGLWVEIASFSTPQAAYIAKGMLEANDIPSVLTNTVISSVYPMTDTWAPIRMQVPESLADEALALLRAHKDI